MLKEEADLLQICLFGKKYSKHLVASAKKKQKQTIEIFAEKGKKKQKSFWNTPSEAQRRSSGGSIWNSSSTKDMGNQGKKYSTETTAQQLEKAVDSKVKINTKKTCNMLSPPIIPIEDLRNVIHG